MKKNPFIKWQGKLPKGKEEEEEGGEGQGEEGEDIIVARGLFHQKMDKMSPKLGVVEGDQKAVGGGLNPYVARRRRH